MRGTDASRQEFSKAVYNLAQGTPLTMFNQPTYAQRLAVGDTPGKYLYEYLKEQYGAVHSTKSFFLDDMFILGTVILV